MAGWLLIVVASTMPALAAVTETFRDDFDTASYAGNNGTTDWAGSWIESGEADGPSSGRARVLSTAECTSGFCARLGSGGATLVGLEREADLAAASSATLSFSYRRLEIGGAPALVTVAASGNGGGGWTTIASYLMNGTDVGPVAQSLSLNSVLAADTRVRFQIESVPGQNGTFFLDAVQIAAQIPDPTTTTTATTSTTTTTSSTTTTTTSPPTTTTTTAPTTTTTTLPPSPSTTVPGGSTTTVGPGTTTTTTTTAVPPTVSTSVAPGTSTTVAALPPPVVPPTASTNPSVRPPFPISINEAGSNGDGGSARSLATSRPPTAPTDPDVSTLIRSRFGDPVARDRNVAPSRGVAVVLEEAGRAAGAVWPTLLVMLGGLAFSLLANPRSTRSS